MYSDEIKSSAVAAILNRFDYVLIDTCSLMDPACPQWMDALHNAKEYRKKKEPIIVPRRCYDELKKHARDKSDDSKRIAAKRGLKILRKAKWDRLLTVTKKDKNENFADNAIYVRVGADRLFSKILIITQDKFLASDLLALNKLRSQQGRPVEVFKIVNEGKMVPNLGEPREHQDRREYRPGGPLKQTSPNPKQPAQAAKTGNTYAEIQAADARLCAVMSNPNYPDEKKKADAEAQLKTLQSLSPAVRSKLNLKVDIDRIQQFLHPSPAGQEKPAKTLEAKKAPAPKKAEATKKEEPTKKERLWYGKGDTVKEAFLDCAKHYGILFRSASVKYFPEAHGPLDMTEVDLETICMRLEESLAKEEKATLTFLDTDFIAQKHDDHFHCYIDVLNSPSFQQAKSEPKPAETKPTKKPAAKKKVAEPKQEPAPEQKPAEPAKKPAKKAKKTEKAAVKSEKEKGAATVKKATKKAEPKPEETKAEAPVKEKKPAELKAKPAAKKKVAEAKPEAKEAPAEKAKELTPFEQAQKNEHSLKCNLKNPNYASEKKVTSIDKQLALMAKLSPEEVAKLTLSKETLQKLRDEAQAQ